MATSPASTSDASIAARLDRLPPSRYVRGLVMRISLGGFFEFYDLFMTAYIAVGFLRAKIFVASAQGFFDVRGFASFVGAGFAGMFVGTLLFSWISDRYGRRATFTLSLLWYSLATLVMACMSTPAAIDAWRFLAGIGVGVQLITIDTYITEITPKESRGSAIALSQFVTFWAVPCVALIAYLLVPRTIAGFDGWRFVALIGALGAVAVWPLRAGLPESPRWLETHGRRDEALRGLREMEGRVAAETGRPLPPPEEHLAGKGETTRGAWSEIWQAAYRQRTVMLIVFNVFQTIGFYGFASWVPTLLLSEGITETRSLAYVFIIALVNPLGALIGVRYADRLQRKWQIVVLALIIAVCGLLWAQQRTAAGIVVLGALITLANNWFSVAYHAYQAELYPTRIRAQAVGFVYSWSRFSSIFVGFVIAAVLRAYGVGGVFVIIAIAMAIVAATIALLGPLTNRVRLEALSR
ncbi:MAG TPA: MFS transporter [Candidatus Limnocylindria bacterium]|jgi:putative MFS transporter|nr:MFS transporter [Candidatus Limnocylindria bacterium]